MPEKIMYEEVKTYLESFGYKVISDEYINSRTKLNLIDNFGYNYITSYSNFRRCNNIQKMHPLNPYTIQNINLWCNLNNKQFELITKTYKNDKIKLMWKCLKEGCGEVFESCWQTISQGHGCPYCEGLRVGLSNCLATKNPELSKEWHPTKNGDLTPYDVTCGSWKDVWWICEKSRSHIWKQKVSVRNHGHNCPYCSGRFASEENNLMINNPKLCEEWDYDKNIKHPKEYTPNNNKKVWWKCKECNYEWETSIAIRNSGKCGCPNCNKSKGENKIKEWLEMNNIYYISQKEFIILIGLGGGNLSYDFYLPKYNLLIEYQGEYHEKKQSHVTIEKFEKQQEHDRRKKEYAENNNITLLEIWYWNFNNIEEILNNNIKGDLNNESK